MLLDKLLLLELSESVLGASVRWNIACTVSNRIYAIYIVWNSTEILHLQWRDSPHWVLTSSISCLQASLLVISVRSLSRRRLPISVIVFQRSYSLKSLMHYFFFGILEFLHLEYMAGPRPCFSMMYFAISIPLMYNRYNFDSLSFIHTNSCTFSYNYVSVF